MNPEDLVGGGLRSVLLGRSKRSGRALRYLTRDLTRGTRHIAHGAGRFAGSVARGGDSFWTRPSTLLGAVGLAWGIFESLQGSTGSTGSTGSSGSSGSS